MHCSDISIMAEIHIQVYTSARPSYHGSVLLDRAWEHSLRIHAECAIGGNELLTTRGNENPEVPRRGTLESPLAQELLDLRPRESQRLRTRERLKREFYAAPVVCLAIRWLI